MSSLDWKNKTIFLTGASSGIGEGLALALAKKGATLGLLARRENLLNELAKKCEDAGGRARAFPADVTDASAIREAVAAFANEFTKIDILIANAGIGWGDRSNSEYDPAGVKQVMDVNFLGAVNAVNAVLPGMLEKGSGQLVAISSLAGIRGLRKSAAYCASKAAMTIFFESVRLDVKDKGVDVTIIQPGFIRTPLTADRANRMPYLMELDDAIPHFVRAIEKKKKFAAFPWQLATIVRAGKFMPAWMYDRIASRTRYRE